MRLWIVNQYAVPRRGPGGTRTAMLARQLVRRGHEVTLLTSAVSYVDGRTTVPLGGHVFAEGEAQRLGFGRLIVNCAGTVGIEVLNIFRINLRVLERVF